MGLIHTPRLVFTRSTVHDLSALNFCQNILDSQLNDLLCVPPRDRRVRQVGGGRVRTGSSGSGAPALVDDPPLIAGLDLGHGGAYTRLPLDAERVVFLAEQLYHIYQRHYDLVQRALAEGELRYASLAYSVAEQTLADSEAVDATSSSESRTTMRLYQHARALALGQPEPATILARLREVWSIARPGDILDLCGYRGTGYFYICAVDSHAGTLTGVCSRGAYGCQLPAEAWSMIDVHGLVFFDAAYAYGCFLPEGTRVQCRHAGKTVAVTNDRSHYITWLHPRDRLTINAVEYVGELREESRALI